MNSNLSPVDWAKRPLQKYADFTGRAPRAEFWWYVLAVLVLSIVARIIDSILSLHVIGPYGPLSLIVTLGLLLPNIAVAVRRLHDTNRTGWWLLLPIVPYCLAFILGERAMMMGGAGGGGSSVGMAGGAGIAAIFLLIGGVAAILLLVFYCLPSTPGENRYGPNPYGEGARETSAK